MRGRTTHLVWSPMSVGCERGLPMDAQTGTRATVTARPGPLCNRQAKRQTERERESKKKERTRERDKDTEKENDNVNKKEKEREHLVALTVVSALAVTVAGCVQQFKNFCALSCFWILDNTAKRETNTQQPQIIQKQKWFAPFFVQSCPARSSHVAGVLVGFRTETCPWPCARNTS